MALAAKALALPLSMIHAVRWFGLGVARHGSSKPVSLLQSVTTCKLTTR